MAGKRQETCPTFLSSFHQFSRVFRNPKSHTHVDSKHHNEKKVRIYKQNNSIVLDQILKR
jgi:hypothetical protein